MSQESANKARASQSTFSDYGVDTDDRASDAPLKLLVVDRLGTFSADIERAARSLEEFPKVVTSSRPTRLLEDVRIESPDVVLAAPEEMTVTGLRRLAQIHRASPKTIITLTQGATPISMTEAASCGASEVISYPASTVRLRNALHRILATAEAVRGERVVIREVPAPAPAPAPAPVARARVGNATIFTVTSPTGGCGKTFFATNLAAYLVGVTGGRVLLVDLDLQFGEVSLALGLRPQRTISELINEEDMEEVFPEYLMEHSSGYQVLSAPADPFAAELVGPREATRVLECARGQFDYIVVDTPPSLNEVVLAAFDQSRYLVVMATLDVPSLRNLRVFLETIDRLKLPAEDISCVLNKAEPDNGIDLQELLRVYPRGFAAVLPYSKEVSRSLNIGQPVLTGDPRAEISQKLLEAGAKLVPAADVTNPTWGARPAGRASWRGRRKERQEQMPVNRASPPRLAAHPQPAPQRPASAASTAAALHHQAPAADRPRTGSSVESPAATPPAARAPDETMLGVAFDAEPVPFPPAGRAPSRTKPKHKMGGPGATSPTVARTPSGLAYHAAPATSQKESWPTRMLLRAGLHSSQRWDELPAQPAKPQPSLATQMRVGPVSGTSAGNPLGRPNRQAGTTTDAPSSLAFSGSRQVASPQRAQSRRERPTEARSTNRKEPKR
ncbi:MAG TPA: AAA family ATPase [Actinomycetota bacterium]|nr:AAA family ATPase [Actinomycetota bacterium]